MSKRPAHAPLTQFPVIDDQLIIGGKRLSELAAMAGQTPFYVYDRKAISARVSGLRAALPDGISLHYAIKANPMPALVAHLAERVDGMDVASSGELQIALDAGVPAAEISFAGPGKRERELRDAITAGITVNLESPGELERIAVQGETLGIRPRVAVRVNPDFELKMSGMQMSGGPKPFGIDAEMVPVTLKRIGELDLLFRGFHIFSGSQNLKPDSLIEAQNATFELAYRLAATTPAPVELLNIGGGFGIPYFPGEQRLELSSIADNLSLRLSECGERLGDAEVVLEFGRYLVGECGVYISRVIDKKQSRGYTFLVVDGGLHHHLAASGNFGQVIRKNYPVINPQRVFGEPQEQVSVVGPLCTPLDLLADKMPIGRAEPGDYIAVLQSGAYGFSASPHRFLSHPDPVEILV